VKPIIEMRAVSLISILSRPSHSTPGPDYSGGVANAPYPAFAA
jgi:hypothetical protein